MASMGVISRTEWTMAHVATGGIFQLWQWLDASRSQDIISAEWQGPIYPND